MSSDAPETETIYKIITSDEKIFEMPKSSLEKSGVLKALVGNLNYNTESSDPIPINNVSGETFEMVLKWCAHHKDDAPVENSDSPNKNIVLGDWDREFLAIDNEKLFNLICSANYLEIQGLLEVSCKVVANMITGKGPEEMRQIFGIPTDEEDEAAAKASEAAANSS